MALSKAERCSSAEAAVVEAMAVTGAVVGDASYNNDSAVRCYAWLPDDAARSLIHSLAATVALTAAVHGMP